MALSIAFDNSYARLPERFFRAVQPAAAPAPRLLRLNEVLAAELGLDAAALRGPEGVAMLSGNAPPAGAAPIAMAYAGHQFGGFVPQLGDGRAILLGEVIDRQGRRRDLQLKGSGRTPFSRGGDGRAALGPVLREYLVSEAMAALGVPTTRALSAVATGEEVFRDTALPGAVLCRVAASHIRVGTFQFFAARRDVDGLRALADHAIARHDPAAAEAANPYRAFLDGVVARQARLVAQWLLVGFVHGVMNTDNTSVSGETIDYGPCAFLDRYDTDTVFSSIDHAGRYAYGNQPSILLWNLAMLAGALLPLLGEDEAAQQTSGRAAIESFGPVFEAAYHEGLRRKIGLGVEGAAEDGLAPAAAGDVGTAARAGDVALVQDLLALMAQGGVDFTLCFRRLCDAAEGDAEPVRALFADQDGFDGWEARWRERLRAKGRDGEAVAAAMRAVNPAYIPRNHLVEEALAAAVTADDLGPFEALLAALAEPFRERPGLERYALPPEVVDARFQTFCGT